MGNDYLALYVFWCFQSVLSAEH